MNKREEEQWRGEIREGMRMERGEREDATIDFKKKFYLFIYVYFWLHWVFFAAHRLSLVAASGDYSSLRCMGFSLQWLLLLQSMGSRHVGFSSCGTGAQ